jgi:pilus assembly protein CpaE
MGTGEKVRILIVDDIADTRENIRKLLQFELDMEVVGTARTGREAIELSRELRPDVVIMDINMPDMDGITATDLIRKNQSFTQIVILSVQGDPNYMRRAMLAGARDFLTKPPIVDELTTAIRRAGKMAQEERAKTTPVVQMPNGMPAGMAMTPSAKGKIITVYSPKGGTGATLLAANLAMTLNNEETRVVLVDGNLQFGDISVFLNVQTRNSIVDLAPRADELDVEIVEEVISIHGESGVRLLAAPSKPEQAEHVTGDQYGKVLQFLRHLYPYVVVDAASSLTDITLAALDASDLIILLTTQEIPAIKNARLFFDLADILKLDRKRVLLVMNRYDKRIAITPEKVGESFRHEVSAVIPVDEHVVVPSINRGLPFMLGDRSKPISRSLLELAEAVRIRLNDLNGHEQEPILVSKKTTKR